MPPTTKTTEHGRTEEGPVENGGSLARAADLTTEAPSNGAPSAADSADAPTATLPTTDATPSVGVAAGDRCATCGSPLAQDQRYCLVCGERRGQARFAAAAVAGPSSASTAAQSAPKGSRFPPSATLIAGVATLLLALGIGVLIGRDSAPSSAPANTGAQKVQVVPLAGASGAAAATVTGSGTPATSAGSSGGGGGSSASSGGKSKQGHSAANAHTTQAASTAAATSSAAATTTAPSATVTVGATGHGPGYQKGKFTGNFFGP
jgi:hypothetical protein